MRFMLRHVPKSICSPPLNFVAYKSCLSQGNVVKPWICQQCRLQCQSPRPGLVSASLKLKTRSSYNTIRVISTSQSNESSNGEDAAMFKERKELPSQEEGRRSHISKRFSHVMDHLQSNIFIAGQRLNDLTGYSGIEALKKDIEEQEQIVRTSRTFLLQAKEQYSTAIAQRSGSQREVNELLQRKHAWSAQDLERFTSLYRSDHANEQSESTAQETLAAAERKAEEAAAKLSTSILARYHEEQIWSDKIRRMSTWGTWGLMGVNVLLFLVFQIGVEPWRRKRLVKGFEEKVMEALEKEGAATGAMFAAVQAASASSGISTAKEVDSVALSTEAGLEEIASIEEALPGETVADETVPNETLLAETVSIEPLLEETIPEDALSEKGIISDGRVTIESVHAAALTAFKAYKEGFRDLFSDRQMVLRRVDITTLALEGAAAGAALVGILVILVRSR